MSDQETIRELYVSLCGVMNLVETSKLVRNIDNDHSPDWMIEMMNLVKILKRADEALKIVRYPDPTLTSAQAILGKGKE